jgi:hypothetical protein
MICYYSFIIDSLHIAFKGGWLFSYWFSTKHIYLFLKKKCIEKKIKVKKERTNGVKYTIIYLGLTNYSGDMNRVFNRK